MDAIAVNDPTNIPPAPPTMTRRAWCGRCGVYTYDGEKIPCSEKSGYTWEACELSRRMPEVVPIEERQKHEEAKAAAQQEKAQLAKLQAESQQLGATTARAAQDYPNMIPLSALGVQELLQRPDISEDYAENSGHPAFADAKDPSHSHGKTWDQLQGPYETTEEYGPGYTARAINLQVGGNHYKEMAIQPITYVMANGIPFPEGNIIKYVTRWRSKGGLKDLEKARHMLDVLIEFERDRAAA